MLGLDEGAADNEMAISPDECRLEEAVNSALGLSRVRVVTPSEESALGRTEEGTEESTSDVAECESDLLAIVTGNLLAKTDDAVPEPEEAASKESAVDGEVEYAAVELAKALVSIYGAEVSLGLVVDDVLEIVESPTEEGNLPVTFEVDLLRVDDNGVLAFPTDSWLETKGTLASNKCATRADEMGVDDAVGPTLASTG